MGIAAITFKKQPILLNMIIGGLFAGFFMGMFAFAFTQDIIIAAVIAFALFTWELSMGEGQQNI